METAVREVGLFGCSDGSGYHRFISDCAGGQRTRKGRGGVSVRYSLKRKMAK